MSLKPKSDEIKIVTPDYWEEACKHLAKKDRVMRRLIPQYGEACLQSRGDAFVLTKKLTPAGVLKMNVDHMRAAGLSARKVEYLVDLALHFDNDGVRVKEWSTMQDEEIIAELVAIRGIGRWTAEMLLIFHLMRPHVLPLDDVGLINGISHNYFSGESVSRSEAREVAAPWAPFCSVATWYIWRSLDPVPVEY